MMFTETKLPGSFIIDPERLEDERSFFARTWCQHEFAALASVSAGYHATFPSIPNKAPAWPALLGRSIRGSQAGPLHYGSDL